MSKGIILAAGTGSRLHPITAAVNKHLLPIYDKPMIYYPLTTLMLAGVTEVLIIVGPNDLMLFHKLLGSGALWGIYIRYKIQDEPKGIGQAFTLGEEFIGDDDVWLILGDNIFHGHDLHGLMQVSPGCNVIHTHTVRDPERYGVLEDWDTMNPVIREKPKNPKTNNAVTGLYYYCGPEVIEIAKEAEASQRGEIEITSINNVLLGSNRLGCQHLSRGIAWLDAGTPESMLQASMYIQAIEERQGLKIACPEEVAYNMEFIDSRQLESSIAVLPSGPYRDYLEGLMNG